MSSRSIVDASNVSTKKSRRKRKLIIIGILFVLGSVAAALWLFKCYGLFAVSVHIGKFDSKEAGLRAAIPELVREMKVCPWSETYRVIWDGPDPEEQSVRGRSLLYNRKRKRLGYEQDLHSGISGKVYLVDEAAIKTVAEQGGTLEDFAAYDQSQR